MTWGDIIRFLGWVFFGGLIAEIGSRMFGADRLSAEAVFIMAALVTIIHAIREDR